MLSYIFWIGLVIIYVLFLFLIDMKVEFYEKVRKQLRKLRMLEYKLAFSEQSQKKRSERIADLNTEIETIQDRIKTVDFFIEQFS